MGLWFFLTATGITMFVTSYLKARHTAPGLGELQALRKRVKALEERPPVIPDGPALLKRIDDLEEIVLSRELGLEGRIERAQESAQQSLARPAAAPVAVAVEVAEVAEPVEVAEKEFG